VRTPSQKALYKHTHFKGNTLLGSDVKANCFLKLFLASLLLRPLLCQWSSPLGQHCSDRKRDGRREREKKQKERERNGWKKKRTELM